MSGGAELTGRPNNWGRWGPDDQRGSLNLLTPDRVAAAVAIPRQGRIFELGVPVSRSAPVAARRNPTWHVSVTVTDPARRGDGRAEDMLVMHTHAHSHIDGLAHVWFDDSLYNGVSPNGTVGRGGTTHASIAEYGGIVGTATLLDVTPDGPFGPGDMITAELLQRAADRVGGDCSACDVILIRTGWDEVLRTDPERYHDGEPGLGPDGGAWVASHDPACVGMDNFAIEPIPTPPGLEPLANHRLFLRDLGTPLMECLDLAAPAAHGVGEGLFMAAPLKIERGLGSPLNPLLIV